MELIKLSMNETKNIDVILNNSNEYGCQQLYELMVDLWQNGIKPEQVGWLGKYLNPQLETFTHNTKGGRMIYSAYLTEKVNHFNHKFVWPWFTETYVSFYQYLETSEDQDNPRYSEDHIIEYAEFRLNLIEQYWGLVNNPYTFSFLKEEWHTEYLLNLPLYDISAAHQYLIDNHPDYDDVNKEKLDELFELTNWQKYINI